MSEYNVRKALIEAVEASRNSKAMLYVTGDRQGMEAQIFEPSDIFVDHLDTLWPTERLTLILHTKGGNTASAWQLVNLLRTFCDELEIIVIRRALSAGTLICLGANKILMTKQATLGPIDPSLSGPLNPQVPGTPHRAPVSVEAVQGYLDVAQKELGINDASALASIWNGLAAHIHPLVLGQIFRSRQQIRSLATRLLEHQQIELEKAKKIVSFLCSESGSHDHALNRREARELGLTIENPSQDLYDLLRQLEQSYFDEMQLRDPWNPDTLLAGGNQVAYRAVRALIESASHGSHQFISEGTLAQVQVPGPVAQMGIQDTRQFEGWRKEA